MVGAVARSAPSCRSIQLKLRVPGAAEVKHVRARGLAARAAGCSRATRRACAPTSLYTANFYYWWGPEVVGIAFALNNLLRFTNPVHVRDLLADHAARRRARAPSRAWRGRSACCSSSAALGAVILAPYLAILMLFPGLSIRIADETRVPAVLAGARHLRRSRRG